MTAAMMFDVRLPKAWKGSRRIVAMIGTSPLVFDISVSDEERSDARVKRLELDPKVANSLRESGLSVRALGSAPKKEA